MSFAFLFGRLLGGSVILLLPLFKDIPKRCKVTFTLHIIILIVYVNENVLHGFIGVVSL